MMSFLPPIHLPSCSIKVKVSEDGSVCGAAVVRKSLESTVLMSTSSHLLLSPSGRNNFLRAQLSLDVFCVGENTAKGNLWTI